MKSFLGFHKVGPKVEYEEYSDLSDGQKGFRHLEYMDL